MAASRRSTLYRCGILSCAPQVPHWIASEHTAPIHKSFKTDAGKPDTKHMTQFLKKVPDPSALYDPGLVDFNKLIPSKAPIIDFLKVQSDMEGTWAYPPPRPSLQPKPPTQTDLKTKPGYWCWSADPIVDHSAAETNFEHHLLFTLSS